MTATATSYGRLIAAQHAAAEQEGDQLLAKWLRELLTRGERAGSEDAAPTQAREVKST